MTTPVVVMFALAALAVAAVVMVVPLGQRRVILRSGTVRRVAESGLAWHLPLAERSVRVVAAPDVWPVRVRATTVDGVPVLVLAEVELRLLPPQVGHAWTDPLPEAERRAEASLAELVATLPVAQLRYALRAAEHGLRERIETAVTPLGVEVLDVEVLEVDLPLASARGSD